MPAGASVVVGHTPGGETFEHTLEPGRPLALEGLLAAELVETPAHLVGEGVESAGELTPQSTTAPRSQAKSAATSATVSQRARASAAASRSPPDHPPAHRPSRAAANPARIRPRQVAATSEAPTSFC